MNEKPVVFTDKEGQHLVGIVHEPEATPRDELVIFAFGGVMGRVAQLRQYVNLARLLAREGFITLRFDSHHMGDSEGELPRCNTKTYYGTIQTGRYVPDVSRAIDFMHARYGRRPIVLIALCGGAITVFLTASQDPRVKRAVMLSVPVALDDSSVDYTSRRGVADYWQTLRPYMFKLTKREYWKRLLSGKSEYDRIYHTFKGLAASGLAQLQRRYERDAKSEEAQETKETIGGATLNSRFFSAFETCALTKRDMLFVFGGNDFFYREFKEAFEEDFLPKHPEYRDAFTLHVLPQASHMFSFPLWQSQLQDIVRNWLVKETTSTGGS